MNQRVAARILASGALILLSPAAHAQEIPWIVLPLAASPIVAALLAAALGMVRKSWLAGLGNAALVGIWMAWFLAASRHSTSDLLTWAPIVALGLHALVMAWLLMLYAVRRSRGLESKHE